MQALDLEMGSKEGGWLSGCLDLWIAQKVLLATALLKTCKKLKDREKEKENKKSRKQE